MRIGQTCLKVRGTPAGDGNLRRSSDLAEENILAEWYEGISSGMVRLLLPAARTTG